MRNNIVKLVLIALTLSISAQVFSKELEPKDLESLGSYLKDFQEARSIATETFRNQSKIQGETLKLFYDAYQAYAGGRKTFLEGAKVKSEAIGNLADARASLADAVLTYAEARKTNAETVLTYAQARLVETQRQKVIAEIYNLWLQTRITQYEFQRIVKGDLELVDTAKSLNHYLRIVKSLTYGTADWKTWVAINHLIRETNALDSINEIIFATKVPPLSFRDNFVSNSGNFGISDFPGGSLGKLIFFSKKNDLSFVQFSDAHEHIMKVVHYINAGTQMSIDRLRNINQSLRLTIAAFR